MAWEALPFDLDENGKPVAPAAPPAAPGLPTRIWEGMKEAVTGDKRTEFPDAPEFSGAYSTTQPDTVKQAALLATTGGFQPEQTSEQQAARDAYMQGTAAVGNSNITPDPEAQFDILSKAIPGLARKSDRHGNLMLKAPGMTDFAYLNKPGLSKRDLDEFGTQTLATLPLMGLAAPVRGAGLVANMARGGAGLAAASVEQDALAGAAGSDQGVDIDRAALDGGIGAGLPAAGALAKGVASGVNTIATKVRNQASAMHDPDAYGARVVQDAFRKDAASGGIMNAAQPSDVPTAARFGQDLRTVDFGGEAVQGEARKAANLSPSARDAFVRVIGDRFEGQGPRADAMITGNLQLGRNTSQEMRNQLKQQARQQRAPLYFQANQLGMHGVDTPLLKQMQTSPIFQRAMGSAERRVADQAATPGWKSTGVRGRNGYTLEFWDQVKQTLDDYAGQAFRTGANSRGAQLASMAKALRDELDAQGQMGALYSQARGTALKFFKAEDALDAGKKFANGNFVWDDAEQAVARLNAPEKNLFQEGFTEDFLVKVRSTPDRSNLLNRIAQSPTERRRLEIALGSQRYQQLDSFLRLEGIMDRLRQTMGNSTTARQLRDIDKGYNLASSFGHLGTLSGDPVSAITGYLIAGGRAAQLKLNENVAEAIARHLTSTDPDVFLKGLQAIGKSPVSDAIRAIDNLIAERGIIQPIAIQTGVNQGE